MKIALLQIDPTVGDLEGNAGLLREAAGEAARAGADLAVASELSLLGYPPRDLLLSRVFVARSWEVCDAAGARPGATGRPCCVGLAEANEGSAGRPLYNAAALLAGGAVRQVFRKTLLPTYDVFDEDRYFEPADGPADPGAGRRCGSASRSARTSGTTATSGSGGATTATPSRSWSAAGAACIVNMSASPFTIGKQPHREAMLGAHRAQARRAGALRQPGRRRRRAGLRRPQLRLRRRRRRSWLAPPPSRRTCWSSTWRTWRRAGGARRRRPRRRRRRRLHAGRRRSGARSCSACATTSPRAASSAPCSGSPAASTRRSSPPSPPRRSGRGNVLGVLMPSPYSSPGSVTDAVALAANLGIRTVTLPIEPHHGARSTPRWRRSSQGRPADVTEENIQARIRGNLLMALSNKFGSLLLTTGNKSELAVGYCTHLRRHVRRARRDLGRAQDAGLPRWRAGSTRRAAARSSPRAILDKAPSAELRPDQTDQDSLPPYDELDGILQAARRGAPRRRRDRRPRATSAPTVERVVRLVAANEFKRKQAAPGLKVTDRAFGMGWRMPIATVPRSRRRPDAPVDHSKVRVEVYTS